MVSFGGADCIVVTCAVSPYRAGLCRPLSDGACAPPYCFYAPSGSFAYVGANMAAASAAPGCSRPCRAGDDWGVVPLTELALRPTVFTLLRSFGGLATGFGVIAEPRRGGGAVGRGASPVTRRKLGRTALQGRQSL